MSFLSTIGLISVGYIIKDRIDNKSYPYKRASYNSYSDYKPYGSSDYSNMNALQILSKRFAEVLADNVTKACYGMLSKKSENKIKYCNYYNPTKVEEIFFETRDKAEQALDKLFILLKKYGEVTVADYYETCQEVDPSIHLDINYINDCYGWKNFDEVFIKMSVHGDYFINLPEPELIKY